MRKTAPLRLARLAASAIVTAGLACACAASSQPPARVAPAASTPPSASATAAAVPRLTLDQTGIVASWMDASADPCQDYFAYACGGFVKSAVIPPDRASWSVSAEMQKVNEDFLHDVLEKAAKSPGDDPAMKKIGDYYAACTDEDAIEKAGAIPIKPLLDDIAKVKDAKTLADVVTRLHALSIFPLFDVSAG